MASETTKTQRDLAAEIGVKQPAVARWLSGRVVPREENLLRLAQALGQTPEETLLYLRQRRAETQKKSEKKPVLIPQ